MAEDKYNLKNPAVKRILQEVKEMQSNPSDDFMSLPLEVSILILDFPNIYENLPYPFMIHLFFLFGPVVDLEFTCSTLFAFWDSNQLVFD